MPISYAIYALTGPVISGTPSQVNVAAGSVQFNREDTISGSTPIPIPTSASVTNFSYVKTFQFAVLNNNGLLVSQLIVGTTSGLSGGVGLFYTTAHTFSQYTQATAPPATDTAHGVGSQTVCTINGATATLMPIFSGATPYALTGLPQLVTGNVGNLVEVCLGVDGSCALTGQGVNIGTLQWGWTEA